MTSKSTYHAPCVLCIPVEVCTFVLAHSRWPSLVQCTQFPTHSIFSPNRQSFPPFFSPSRSFRSLGNFVNILTTQTVVASFFAPQKHCYLLRKAFVEYICAFWQSTACFLSFFAGVWRHTLLSFLFLYSPKGNFPSRKPVAFPHSPTSVNSAPSILW